VLKLWEHQAPLQKLPPQHQGLQGRQKQVQQPGKQIFKSQTIFQVEIKASELLGKTAFCWLINMQVLTAPDS